MMIFGPGKNHIKFLRKMKKIKKSKKTWSVKLRKEQD